MLAWIRILSFVLVTMSVIPAHGKGASADDLLPWPWGSECPFPWTRIEGDWIARSEDGGERFSLNVKRELDNGARVLEVRRYDALDNLIARGEGVSAKSQRVVRAAMVGVGAYSGESYWALIRTYSETQKRTCSKNKQVTVITLRPANESTGDHDVHIIVDKEGSVRRSKP